jgi:uncharacterized RDD family membrane protein YckC
MNQDPNPYRPPTSNVTFTEPKRALIPAGRGRRFGTLLIDYALFMAICFCLGLVIALAFGPEAIEAIQEVPDSILGFGVMSAYYLFFEGIWARTPGKLLLGTVVVNETGGKPSLKKVIGRTLCRFIPFEPFSCLGERGWHDSIPGTYVVLAKSPQ